MKRNLQSLAVAVVLALSASACGQAEDNAADTSSGTKSTSASGGSGGGGGQHAQHNGSGGGTDGASSSGSDAMTTQNPSDSAMAEMEGMVTLAETSQEDLEVQLHAMPPELFYVSEGDDMRPQKPAATDDAHLMVTLADVESGVRLPDATVIARVIDSAGETQFEGPLYPMVGRGMGMHYGENVTIGEAGDYTVELTIGPPRVGRHRLVAKAWSKTRKITQKVKFDGTNLAKG